MNKNIKLNRNATTFVIERLMKAGFINESLREDRAASGGGRLTINWTQKGTRMVSSYAEALYSIGNPSKRKIDAFHALLARSAFG
jgi:hypothetical protein